MSRNRIAADERPTRTRPGFVAWLLLLPVELYRKAISPLFPPSCRFYPCCSTYTVEALTRHGAARGSYLAVRRILRCGPWTSPGRDPVPEQFSWRYSRADVSLEHEVAE